MNDLEIYATFDTPQTARQASKLINAWFSWLIEGDEEDTGDLESLFDDFGLSFDDYLLDRSEVDLEESPEIYAEGSKLFIGLDTNASAYVDTLKELLEAMGSYDVSVCEEDD